jgi:hypothetical protein
MSAGRHNAAVSFYDDSHARKREELTQENYENIILREAASRIEPEVSPDTASA